VRVVCAGHVNWDVTLCVDSLPDPDGEARVSERTGAGGGSAANTAAALADLGLDVALLGSVGDDQQGRLACSDLEGTGVDCSRVRRVAGGVTTIKYLVVDSTGQVMVLANEGDNEAFAAEDVEDIAAADHLHLTGQRPETARRLAERGASAGVTVSLDPGRQVGTRDFTGAGAYASYLFVNDREAERARESGLLEVVEGVTVVTRGDGGGEVLTDEGTVEHPGFDVEAVDTAGAGDAFAAGFLAARLDGADLAAALSVANACGALASQSAGARTLLSWETVETLRG
jgi:ribokinase